MYEINRLPLSFYLGITGRINDVLVDFYEQNAGNTYYELPFSEFSLELLYKILSPGLNPSELRHQWGILRRRRYRKKKRWIEALSSNDKFMDSESFSQLMKKAEDWVDDPDSLFIHFPDFYSMTPRKAFLAFQDDLLYSIFTVLYTFFPDFNLSDYTKYYIDEMGSAIFAAKNKKLDIAKYDSLSEKEIMINKNGSKELYIVISQDAMKNRKIQSLSAKDQLLLFEIIKASLQILGKGTEVLIELGRFTKALSESRKPGKNDYDDAERRLFHLAEVSYRIMEGDKTKGIIKFLSHVIMEEKDDKKYARISLGSTILEALENNMIRKLPSFSYYSLKNKTARILLLSLQKYRIKAFVKTEHIGQKRLYTDFAYIDLLSMVNFFSQDKEYILESVREAFEEMIAAGVCIKRFSIDRFTDTIRIYWIPFTDAERADISWFGYDVSSDL